MGGNDDVAKAAKKAAKAQAKIEKKLAKKGVGEAPPAPGTAGLPGAKPGPTPAERSAAAAERQARLHGYRMWISLAAALVALATLLATVRPWRFLDRPATTRELPAETDS